MEIIIGEHVKDNTFAHKRIQIPDSEIDHILDVFESKIKVRDNFDIGYAQGYKDGKEKRPTGEWITRTEDNGINYRFYCSCCDREVKQITDFCPYCGADMRGEKDEAHDKTEGMY